MRNFIAQHARKPRGRTIVIWRGVGGRSSIYTEAIIALALRLRGYKTEFILCDKVMSGCIMGKGVGVNRAVCSGCYSYAANILNNYGLSHITFSSFVSEGRKRKFRGIVNSAPYDEIEDYVFHDVPVGVFAKDSLIRHLRGAPIEPRRHSMFREFLFSSLVCLEAARVYYHRYRPNLAIFQRHFEYVGWGPAYHYFAANKGMRIVGWQGCIDSTRLITMMSCGSDYPVLYQISDEVWEELKTKDLTKVEIAFANKRLKPTGISRGALLQQLKVSDNKPIWCLFPHMSWDIGLSPIGLPFDGADDWLFTTIRAMLNIPGITWLLKSHPGERFDTARGVAQTAREAFPGLEEHITFITPRKDMRPPDLSLILSGGITLQGSVAIEFPALGIPMIVGGAKYPGKEFTYNAETKEDYIKQLYNIPNIKPLSQELSSWAKKYLYYVHVRKKLPTKVADSNKGYKPIIPERLNLLLPGKDTVIDMICDNIINGGEFDI